MRHGHPLIHGRYLHQNSLCSLSDFPALPSLRVLSLCCNHLTSISGLEGSNARLETLTLSGNHLAGDLDALTTFPGLTTLDLVAGGRIIEERADALVSLTSQFDFRYTVHGLVSSNFMDPVTAEHQLDAETGPEGVGFALRHSPSSGTQRWIKGVADAIADQEPGQ